MTTPILLDLTNAKMFLGNDLNNFSSAISYDTDNNYHFYVISFSLPKKFIGLKGKDEIYSHQRLSHQLFFGNVEDAPDNIEFNFECKCRAEKGHYELIVFKPWCKDSNLDIKAVNAIEDIFFLCIDIRLFLVLLRKSLQKQQVKFEDFTKARVLDELEYQNFWSYSLTDRMFDIDDNASVRTTLSLSEDLLSYSFKEQLNYITEKGFKDCLSDNPELKSKYLDKSGITFPFSSFIAEATNWQGVCGYVMLFNIPYLYKGDFGAGFYIDIFLKEKSDLIYLKACFEAMVSFIGKQTTAINLYLDNRDDKFGYLLYDAKDFSYSKRNDEIVEINISKDYYKELTENFQRQDFSDFNFYGDPYEHPQIFRR